MFRKVLFQVHLWTGLAVGAYVVLIGVTGAVLVFRPELQARTYPQFFAHRPAGAPLADAAVVVASIETAYPGYRFSGIDFPTGRRGTFLAYVTQGDAFRTVFVDAVSGRVLGELPRDGWIQRLQDLHFNLLLGQTGVVVNGVAAACLLALCLTGVAIWWPAAGRWTRGFRVDIRRGWKRVIWELHGAVGAWTVVLLLMWTVSGIYFSFPSPFRAAVARVAPMRAFRPVSSGTEVNVPPPALADLLDRAQARVSGAQLARLVMPFDERSTYSVVLARGVHGDYDSSDEVTVSFDRYTGAIADVDDQRDRGTGDAIITWLGRLHVGGFGGLPVKVVWAIGGLAFPTLFVTGFVMWWNRVVRPARSTRTR